MTARVGFGEPLFPLALCSGYKTAARSRGRQEWGAERKDSCAGHQLRGLWLSCPRALARVELLALDNTVLIDVQKVSYNTSACSGRGMSGMMQQVSCSPVSCLAPGDTLILNCSDVAVPLRTRLCGFFIVSSFISKRKTVYEERDPSKG